MNVMSARTVDPPEGDQARTEPADLLDRQLTYTLFRLTLGVQLLLHGATHLFAPGGETFSMFLLREVTVPSMPFFSTALALLTAGLGLLLVLGLWTRRALTLGGALVTVLVVGTAPLTDWKTMTVQTLYLGMFYCLPVAGQYNVFSADALLRKSAEIKAPQSVTSTDRQS